MNNSKMYILVLDDVPADMVPVICAHASLSAYLRAIDGESLEENMKMSDWADTSFKKVVCKVTQVEFNRAVEYYKPYIITESSLHNKEVACVYIPNERQHEVFFKYLRLYKVSA